jgi:hypothetical protein
MECVRRAALADRTVLGHPELCGAGAGFVEADPPRAPPVAPVTAPSNDGRPPAGFFSGDHTVMNVIPLHDAVLAIHEGRL